MIKTAFGAVLKDPAIKYSGKGLYKNIVDGMVKAAEAADEKGGASPP